MILQINQGIRDNKKQTVMEKSGIKIILLILAFCCNIQVSAININITRQDSLIVTLTENEFSQLDEAGLNGEYHILFPDGKLQEIRIYNNGHIDGTWTRYNENEIKIAVATYKNDKKHGKWIIWDDKGKKRYEMEYTEGNRSGIWYSWDENGKLLNERKY